MELQNLDLSSGMQGEDVDLLIKELLKIGYAISEDEREIGAFRGSTKEAVEDFQCVGSNSASVLHHDVCFGYERVL